MNVNLLLFVFKSKDNCICKILPISYQTEYCRRIERKDYDMKLKKLLQKQFQ